MKQAAYSDRCDPRIAFFDHHAAHWDDNPQEGKETLRRFCELKERLGLKEGMEVLEVGCGTGQITALLAAWVYPGRVTAIDFSPAMLDRARKKGIDADFRQFDVCAGPVDLERFDAVLCFQSFPHFRDKPAALQSMARSLKPGGRLVVLHFAGSAQINAFHQQTGGAVANDTLPAAGDWQALLRTSGLRLETLEDRDGLLLVEARRDRDVIASHPGGSQACPSIRDSAVSRSAFTLIELLVVMSIVAILAGLGFPAMARAREKARVIKVHAELYGIGLALQMYGDDHAGQLPPVRVNCNSDLATHWCQLPIELAQQRYLPRSQLGGREADMEDPFAPGQTYKYAVPGPQLLNGDPVGSYEFWVPDTFPQLDGNEGTYYGDPKTSPIRWAVWSLGPRWPSAKAQNSRAPVSSRTWYKHTGDSGVIVRLADRDGFQTASR